MSFITPYPAGTQYAAILDTNAYRELFTGLSTPEIIERVRLLTIAEEAHQIQAVALTIAAAELVGSLVEGEEGFNYADCLSGLIGMAHHCHKDNETGIRILPTSYLQITNSFFHTIPEKELLDVHKFAATVTDFKMDPTTALKHHWEKNTFDQVKTWLQKSEEEFAQQIVDLIKNIVSKISEKDPNLTLEQVRQQAQAHILSPEFEAEIVSYVIMDAAIKLQRDLTVEEGTNLCESMLKAYPLAIGFTRWVIFKVYYDNVDMMSKRSRKSKWNWIWDYQAAFIISDVPIMGEIPFVVTKDDGIHEVLDLHGYGNRVITLSEYKNRLGITW